MDWEKAWRPLRRCFDDTLASVRERRPELLPTKSHRLSTPFFPMIAHLAFLLDPSQEHETLLLQFICGDRYRGFWCPDGTSYFPDLGPGRHAVHLLIQTGTGEELARLEPRLLPVDVDSTEYEDAVLDYVTASVDFIKAHTELIASHIDWASSTQNG